MVFVLSTGRTGTTFLHQFLTRYFPELPCYQEPRPSWIFNIYANLLCSSSFARPLESFMQEYYLKTRRPLLTAGAEPFYMEINPFLYSLGPILSGLAESVKIIHMIRHPIGFITSSLNFNPQGWRALFKDFPGWNLNVAKAWKEKNIPWRKLSGIEKRAWQWCYINHRIQSDSKTATGYLCLKFEDLFESDQQTRRNALSNLTSFLEIPFPKNYQENLFSIKANPSNAAWPSSPDQWDPLILNRMRQDCGGLMADFQYDLNSYGALSHKAILK